ncbi:MAG: FtsX-like permease family protein [Dehalococcoidia bacterium]|nr:FtsX-like permease family protein [Dehalococcoidia bacterium]
MQELFGVSVTTIAIVMAVLFGIAAIVAVTLAVRNRIMFKLGVRNIPKRPVQTALIVFGLMLSTVLITAAFSTGDTVVYTIRSLATDALGNTDEVIAAPNRETAPDLGYFDYAVFERIRDGLADAGAQVDGVLPVIREQVPVINAGPMLSAPSVTPFAPAPQEYATYTSLTLVDGQKISLDDLGTDGVYLDKSTAEDLQAEVGDGLLLFIESEAKAVRLAGIVKGASSGGFAFALMPLPRAQELLGKTDQINAIYISNSGGVLGGAKYSKEVEEDLQPLLEGTGLEVEKVKESTLDQADTAGTVLTTMFVGFGLFSIAAGVLLIFLIFVMLAAARKSEMGMARAVGAKRNQLVQMFIFEGVVYDLMAAIIGVGLGILVTYAIAGIMARVIQGSPIDIRVHVEPRSLIVAFTLGMLVTFATVAVSAWRVSRLNIVRAIRDIPEPVFKRVGRGTLGIGVSLAVFGLLIFVAGIGSKQGAPLYMGLALIIVGGALIARWRGARERLVFTVAGVLLLAWSLLPTSVFETIFGDDMTMGIEMFFLAGVTMVLGAVWIVSYNLDVILRILAAVVGRLKGAAPVLRAAMAYPMKNRMRTGLTIAMFSLVIFTIVFMSVVIGANTAVLSDSDSFAGGYDIMANVSYINPVPNMQEAIVEKGIDPADFEAIAGYFTIPLKVRESSREAEEEFKDYTLNGVDDVYLDTNTFKFALTAPGYDSAADVWRAVKDTPGLAVISADAVASRSNYGVAIGGAQFRLEGVWLEDKALDAPIQVRVKESYTGTETDLTIIGVLEAVSFNYGLYTSQRTIGQVWPADIPTTTYLFKLSEGVDADEMVKRLESEFSVNGLQATSIKQLLREVSRTSFTINTLLQGFMSLGLVVGIAALGVISTRAVVERRHEIGILRAIGFKRRSVQTTFLLESSIVAILGIIIGSVLALALSYQVLDDMKETVENLEFRMPWVELAIIAGVAWVASMLMTIIPAWQASRIYPAEALRYE